jgi:pilus assembly protein FimV
MPGLVPLAFALSALGSDPAAAVGLGQVAQQSALGQSFRVVVPVLLAPDENIAAECFKLAVAERDADGIPQLAFGRVSFERTSSGAHLVVTNARPVNDPVLRLTLQAGCNTAVRREFVLFMDPPPIETPLVAADSVSRNLTAAAPPPAPSPQAATREAARVAVNAARDAARASAPSRVTGATSREARNPAPSKPRIAAKAAPRRPLPTAAEQPRLKLSSAALPPIASANAGTITEAQQAQAQQELANAIEAETVVLRQRIVELSAMIEKMQQEVRANEMAQLPSDEAAKTAPGAAPPAQPAEAGPVALASEDAAKAPPVASGPGWWEANWPLLAAIIGLPILLAAGLLWKRGRDVVIRVPDGRAAGTEAIHPEPTAVPPSAPRLRNPPAGVANPEAENEIAPLAPKKSRRRAPAVGYAANALAVSELLHVTEEARVYVALGHPVRAIEVLKDHIRQLARPMPAAWLMLLDLYHANGLRQEFRRLAEDFHVHCNVQTPLWEGFGSNELDDGGIETFPHILRQIVDLWSKPECREYLERLLHDNREGRRTGFPLAAYSDILLLLQILDTPAIVDIDSDLAVEGKLGPLPQRVAVAAAAAGQGGLPRSSDTAQVPNASLPERTQSARPAQQPIEFELDLDEEARNRGKKPRS